MTGTSNKYPSPFIVPCKKCNRDIKLYTHQKATSFCCDNCGAYFPYDKRTSLKSNYIFSKTKKVTFRVGTVFNIEHLEFVLINYIVKEETSFNTTWIEYQLFHPVEGYWTLNESEGHFTLIKPYKFYLGTFEQLREIALTETDRYQLYSKYKYKIKHASGEFFYNLLENKNASCADFVSAPYILSYEKTNDEVFWYHGEYIEQKKIKEWIKEDIILPVKEWVAPNQPFISRFDQTSLIRLTVVSILLLFICQLIFSSFIQNPKLVSNETYFNSDKTSSKTYVSVPFNINKDNCAADIELVSNLDNSWLETDFTLVNETTGDQYYFSGSLEFYSGFTDGESWSEGSNDIKLSVGQLKKGKYHYNVLVTNDTNFPFGSLQVKVFENVEIFSNFVIILIVLLVFPVYIHFKKRIFDRKQWFNSDYSPYNYD